MNINFAHPLWLLGVCVIPFVWLAFFLIYRSKPTLPHLENFIDSHLLPHLIVPNPDKKRSTLKTLIFWSLAWTGLTLALAGPRWSYREIETFSKDQSLVILLDLSESMNATDLKPSRLIRAKQKIEDLLQLSQGVKIGLIAFAADPHMITPLTDDKETIRHLLPSLETELIFVQGSRLSPALVMAANMLDAEPGTNKALLVVSDGDFEDGAAIKTAQTIATKGIVIHTLGVGTLEGTLLDNHPVLSKLDKAKLNEISRVGQGRSMEMHYSNHEEEMLLKELAQRAQAQEKIGKMERIWDEHFYLLLFPVLPIFLWWFRRGTIFALLLCLAPLEASADLFRNSEEQGLQAFDLKDYETASSLFQDSYRKGVACYRAGDFAQAEKLFRESREEVACQATYNLGNALVQQQKLQEAIEVYEQVLSQWPDHIKAKENLELVKKMLEQSEQQQKESDSNQKEQNDSNETSEEKEQNDSKEESSEGKEQNESNEESEGKEQNDANEEQNNQDESAEHNQEQQNQENELSEDRPESQNHDEEEGSVEQDADLWLNRLHNDPKQFLKNKFYIETKRNGTKEGVDPW